MQFRAELTPKPFSIKIKHTDKLVLSGSCFTEQIGKKLAAHKFSLIENPNGILFNPFSIARSIMSYVNNKKYSAEDLFYHNELWASRDHHTRFSGTDKEMVLAKINGTQEAANKFIRQADWLLLTLGSAFVYEWNDIADDGSYSNVAANCHKIPTDRFNRRLSSAEEIESVLAKMINAVTAINPGLKIIFTISPVRHLREGFVENNRSKAELIRAVHSLTNNKTVFYFPAYELVIDDLRDYRFYAEDLVHPNYSATNYVWEKFQEAVVDEHSLMVMKAINELNAAMAHKPFNPSSAEHKKFLATHLKKTEMLKERHPYLDLDEMMVFFR